MFLLFYWQLYQLSGASGRGQFPSIPKVLALAQSSRGCGARGNSSGPILNKHSCCWSDPQHCSCCMVAMTLKFDPAAHINVGVVGSNFSKWFCDLVHGVTMPVIFKPVIPLSRQRCSQAKWHYDLAHREWESVPVWQRTGESTENSVPGCTGLMHCVWVKKRGLLGWGKPWAPGRKREMNEQGLQLSLLGEGDQNLILPRYI